MDTYNFKTALHEPECSEIPAHSKLRLDAIEFAKNSLQFSNQPRDDYRELLELTVIFLGDNFTTIDGTRCNAASQMDGKDIVFHKSLDVERTIPYSPGRKVT